FTAIGGAGNFNQLLNADKGEGYGLEVDGDVYLGAGFSLAGGLAWNHTEIKDKRVYALVCAFGGLVTCSVNDPTIVVRGGTYAQIDGNPLPNAPRWQANAAVRYDIPLTNNGSLFVASDVNIQGYTNLVLYKTREFYADGNLELGLKAGYVTADG
ncbi:hypothetical protein LTR94_032432, partial [Friedmanniomyces endolithicus]